MDIFAATSSKDVWHKGKTWNVYQLDSISSQLNVENRLKEAGYKIRYVDSIGREDEAVTLVNSIHSKSYLEIFKQIKQETTFLSNGLMLQPSLYPLALEHALIAKDIVGSVLENKKSFTSIGGGHHCEYDKPLGFGLVNTMAISARYATSVGQRVALLDLDTHYSNGCMDLLRDKENVLMTSLWNQAIPAWKYYDQQNNLLHSKVEKVEDYFGKLENLLKKIEEFKPSLLIYQLGFDVLEMDRMGGVSGMSEEKLVEREYIVKNFVEQLNIPYLIYRGGGYVNYDADEETVNAHKERLHKIQMTAINYHLEE